MKTRYDAVVIGSGFGGAITANRLARAGLSVAILERGRRWGTAGANRAFARTPGEFARGLWQDGKSVGGLDYRSFKNIDVIQSAGVGGGSLYYFNVHMRPPARIFANPRWPERFDRALLSPYYDVAQNMLEARPLTPPVGRDLPPRTRAFMELARADNRDPELLDIAVYTGPQRLNPHGGDVQSPCNYCGSCMLGCHVNAKNTLDLSYIAQAEKRHGAEVFPLHEVEFIAPAKPGGYRVVFRRIDEHHPERREPGSVLATRVIVAAGALGSTGLLMRCRNRYQTLPTIGPALGQCVSGNGDMLIPSTTGLPMAVDAGRGPSITAGFRHATEDHDIVIEDLGLPNPLLWFLEGALPTPGNVRRKLGLAGRYLLQRVGVSRRGVNENLDALLYGERAAGALPYLGIGTDAADGVMRLRNGAIDIEWHHHNSMPMFREMERVLARMSRAGGGRYAPSPLWRWPLRKLLTAHPLGGCVLGDAPETSVVNHCGEVWQYPGLYVTDGATIPTALAANPSLTISAIAERAAFWMIHGREMTDAEARALIHESARPSGLRILSA